jgi:cytochrome c peroxidase
VGCAGCHNGTNFGGTMMQKFGLMGGPFSFVEQTSLDLALPAL